MGVLHRLRARIAITVLAVALLVAGGLTLLLVNTLSLRGNTQATVRADTYLLAVIDVDRLVIDAETGLRGYVITGRKLFLTPLSRSRSSLPGAIATLLAAARADHALTRQAHAFAEAAGLYVYHFVPEVVAVAEHRLRRAQSFVLTKQDKQFVDTVRTRSASLEAAVAARQRARQRGARDSADQAVGEAIGALVLLTLLTALLATTLGRLAVGREQARERTERTANTLQQSLLPSVIPSVPGCEIAVRFTPAGDGGLVGGDFYDVFAVGASDAAGGLGPGRWAIALGDVCGKGAEAAAVTAMARWTLRSLAGHASDPGQTLKLLNQAMLAQQLDGRFITIAFLLISLEGDRARLALACGGHPPPIVVPEEGKPWTVTVSGDLLGIWPEIELRTVELQLRAGDCIAVFSDGVTDRGPGAECPLGEVLRGRRAGTDADALAELLHRFALQPAQAQRDDITILVLRFLGESGVLAAGRR